MADSIFKQFQDRVASDLDDDPSLYYEPEEAIRRQLKTCVELLDEVNISNRNHHPIPYKRSLGSNYQIIPSDEDYLEDLRPNKIQRRETTQADSMNLRPAESTDLVVQGQTTTPAPNKRLEQLQIEAQEIANERARLEVEILKTQLELLRRQVEISSSR
ncbi:hypothetical protein N7535_009256 [Penicillium sp. DV-2018c]|nr:hypothetical protein N7535_009256 [Penicillium sp. DV-2018c]